MKTLIITYGIEKLGRAAYGLAAWKHFWTVAKPTDLQVGTSLYCGDILPGGPSDYAIAIQGCSDEVLNALTARFLSDQSYAPVGGSSGIRQSQTDPGELLLAGQIKAPGVFENRESNWASPALDQVLHEANLAANKGAYSKPRQIHIVRVTNEAGAEVADRRFFGASATLAADADGQLVVEVALVGPTPDPDFSKMRGEDFTRYFSTQVVVDQDRSYAIQFLDGATAYSLTAPCLGASGDQFRFYVPSATLPQRQGTGE